MDNPSIYIDGEKINYVPNSIDMHSGSGTRKPKKEKFDTMYMVFASTKVFNQQINYLKSTHRCSYIIPTKGGDRTFEVRDFQGFSEKKKIVFKGIYKKIGNKFYK